MDQKPPTQNFNPTSTPGYAKTHRTRRDGDRVAITFAMRGRAATLNKQVALLRGPVTTDSFRLTVRASAYPAYLNAAQLSENRDLSIGGLKGAAPTGDTRLWRVPRNNGGTGVTARL